MKKIAFLMTAVAAVLISCQQEELEVIKPAEPTGYVYHFEVSEGETKSTLGDDGVFWAAGDQVGLYPGAATSVAASVNTSVTPKTVTFSTGSPLEAGTSVYSYYPYQAGNADASATKIVFPTVQTGGSDSAMPMAGVPFQISDSDNGTDGVIHFRNLGAVIDFRVYSAKYAGERVSSITFTATSGTNPVSGDATVDLTGVNPNDEATLAVTWPANAANPSSVTLSQFTTVAASKDAAAEGHLYMVVAPGSYSSGTITVVTNAATYTFPFTNQALVRNSLKRFNMNLESANATREARYVRVNSADEIVDGGKYLIVSESNSTANVFHPVLNESNYTGDVSVADILVDNNEKFIRFSSDMEACQILLMKVTDSDYCIRVTAAGNKGLYLDRNQIAVGEHTSTFTFNTNDKTVKINSNISSGYGTSVSRYYLRYSSSAFSSTSSNSASSLALYKLDEGPLMAQSLMFSTVNYEYVLGGQSVPVVLTETPALSGNNTTVTFSSSNPSVATVDASTGAVTVLAAGKTVVTAIVADSDLYMGASAYYILTVLPEQAYSIENDKLASYLDAVDAHPYNPPFDYSTTYMTSDIYGGNTDQTNRLDWPKPVPVNWETVSGSATVLVYNDAACTDEEETANVSVTSSSTADIYNLIPGRVYYYKVMDGDSVLKTGEFRTIGRRRMIKVAESTYGKTHANNCRDFGGQMTISGKTIKYGKMFRGSNMDEVSDEAKDYLLNQLKIGLDVDLRGSSELKNALGLPNEWHTTQTFSSWSDLSNTTKIKNILTKVFSAVDQNKGVYIHCMVGADRTGYVCMLLEAILGVEQGWCDVDYELTSFSGAVDSGRPRSRTGSPVNYYYRTKNGTVQGVDFIYSLSGGSLGTTFQAKAVNYVVNTLGIPLADVQAFQNEMLEDIQ